MNKLLVIFRLIRIKQWIKNGFVGIPFILSLEFLEINFENYWKLVVSVICFCLISSSVYIINDLVDKEEDKLHYLKKKRPLAEGSISTFFAVIIIIVAIAVSTIVTAEYFGGKALFVMLLYLCNSLIYTFFIKRFAIFDAISISIGFVLRVFFGIFCFETPISKWIILLTFTICLFLAFTKRRRDFLVDGYIRKSLKGYNQIMLDKFITISATLAISCYIMYTNEMVNISDNYGFTMTNIFVIFGIFRYLQMLHLNNVDVCDSGVLLYRDKIFVTNIILWGMSLITCLII